MIRILKVMITSSYICLKSHSVNHIVQPDQHTFYMGKLTYSYYVTSYTKFNNFMASYTRILY